MKLRKEEKERFEKNEKIMSVFAAPKYTPKPHQKHVVHPFGEMPEQARPSY